MEDSHFVLLGFLYDNLDRFMPQYELQEFMKQYTYSSTNPKTDTLKTIDYLFISGLVIKDPSGSHNEPRRLKLSNIGIEAYDDETQVRLMKEGKEQKEWEYKELSFKVNQSVIDTNQSVISTNTALVTLNRKLEEYGRQQKNIAYAIAAFTLITTFTGIATLWKACGEPDTKKIELVKPTSTQLDSTLIFQKGIDSSLRIVAKKVGSLKISK